MSSLTWKSRIVSTPDTCHGRPRIKGTRVTVESVLDNIAEGTNFSEIAEDLDIQERDILACLNYSAFVLSSRKTLGYKEIWFHRTKDFQEYILTLVDDRKLKGYQVARKRASEIKKSAAQIRIDAKVRKYFESGKGDHLTKLKEILNEILHETTLSVFDFVSVILYSYSVIGENGVSRQLIGQLIKEFFENSTKEIRKFEKPWKHIKSKSQLIYGFSENEKHVSLLNYGNKVAIRFYKLVL